MYNVYSKIGAKRCMWENKEYPIPNTLVYIGVLKIFVNQMKCWCKPLELHQHPQLGVPGSIPVEKIISYKQCLVRYV